MNTIRKIQNSFEHSLRLRAVKLLNLLLITAVFAFIWYRFYASNLYHKAFFRKGDWVIIILYAISYYSYGRTYDAFQITLKRMTEVVYSQIIAILFTNAISALLTWILMRRWYNFLPYILCISIQVFISIIWTVLTHRWYFAKYPPVKSVMLQGEDVKYRDLIGEQGLKRNFNIIRTITLSEYKLEGINAFKDAEAVFLVGISSGDRNFILKDCIEKGIRVFIKPGLTDIIMSGAEETHMMDFPILRIDRYSPLPEYSIIKRVFDIVFSLVMLAVTSPLLLAVSIAIKMTDRGPVFYKQTRLTKDGKEFRLIKFRSMRVDAEADGVARLSTGDRDSRITHVGRFIRKCRIDELPQFINILKGDMSVVGPRPERPEIAAKYEKELPEFRLRLQAKAGLTGYAQIYGKYNTTPYDKLSMDLTYIAHPSLMQDLKLIFATFKILFKPESTAGVSEGQVTAADGDKNI